MEQPMAQATPDATARDEGFTLLEVVWALFLLGLLAMSALGLFLQGMGTMAHVQRQQAAVSLATAAMDTARSVSGGAVNAAGTSGLIKGRSQTAVTTVWNNATTLKSSDTSDMTIVWDPATGMTAADQWVPVRTAAVVDNQPYTIDTLIGKCYRLRAASLLSQDCVATNPAPSAGTYVETYRVRIVVRWAEGSAGTQAYTYRMSTLIDPSADATWNTALKPYAYDDEFSAEMGSGSSYHAVVANDTVDYDASGSTSPVRNLCSSTTPSSAATFTINTALGVNGIVFNAPSASTAKSGTVTCTYKVRSTAGEESADPATITVHILPKPVNDTIYVASGSTTDLSTEMLLNDLGVVNLDTATRQTTIVPVFSPTVDMFTVEGLTPEIEAARSADAASLAGIGITTTSGGAVNYVAPSSSGSTRTFYYYLVDDPKTTGQRYPSVTLGTVTVTTENTPSSTAFTENYNASTVTADTWQTIDWRTKTGNPTGTQIRVTAITGPPSSPAGRVRIGTTTAPINVTGTTLGFNVNASTPIGTYEITYVTVSPSGKVTSTPSKITVNVLPVGVNSPTTTKTTTGSTRTYTVNPNPTGTTLDFVPSSGVGLTALAISGTKCTAIAPVAGQPLQFTVTWSQTTSTPTPAPSCTVTFKVTSTGTGTGLTPPVVSTASYTMTVTP